MCDDGKSHNGGSDSLPGSIRRVRRPRTAAARTYDRLGARYDTIASAERPYVNEGIEVLDALSGESVLEIGFGTGRALVKLAEAVGEEGRVCGIDISSEMVTVARRRLVDLGLAERTELVKGDAVRLPYRSGRFDAVFTSFTLELFDTPQIGVVLHECMRVLRRHGRICVVSLSSEGGPYPVRRLYEWIHDLVPRLIDCRPIYAARMMEQCGFRLSEVIRRRMWGLPVEVVLADRPAHRSRATELIAGTDAGS